MSTWATRKVLCPCGHRQDAVLADGLHITRLPEVRLKILAGTFHNVACGGCGVVQVVHTKTLYTDFERYHWVAVAPPWLVEHHEIWSEVLLREFDQNVRVAAPPMIQEMADAFEVRLVFGLDALAERLRAWDAGLDDRLVEVVKWQIFLARRDLFPPGARLRLMAVDRDAWLLRFSLRHAPSGETHELEASLDMLLEAEMQAKAAPPELMRIPFGGLDRMFASSQASASRPAQFMRVVAPMRPWDDGWLRPEAATPD
jgi:hypothetical protein